MGSHYIPVGKLKIDKSLLDIACPAAGYGETPPPPEIYCPANGYTKEEEGKWEPVYEIPDPSDESIVLVFENSGNIAFRGFIGTSAAGNTFHIIIQDIDGNILEDFDASPNDGVYFVYPEFPASMSEFLVMTIKPREAGITILSFWTFDDANITVDRIKIVEARFNVPSITDLNGAFAGIAEIKKVSFFSPMPNLTSLVSFLSNSGIEYFKFPPYTFASLSTMNGIFRNSQLKTCDWNNAKFPELTNISEMFYLCIDFSSFLNFNPGPVKLTTMSKFLMDAVFLASEMDLSGMEVDSSSVNISDAFRNTSIKKLKMFKIKQNTTLSGTYFISISSMLKEIDWSAGDFELEFTGNMVLNTLPNLQKVTAPKILRTNYNYILTASNSSILKEVVLPEYLYGTGQIIFYSSVLEILTNVPVCDENLHIVNISSPKLPTFEIPTMRIQTITLGSTGGSLSLVVVDWANSFTHSYTATTILVNLKGNLSTASINAIFTALPTIPGGRIDVRYNPGYAGCDKTIAEAKGWTVL